MTIAYNKLLWYHRKSLLCLMLVSTCCSMRREKSRCQYTQNVIAKKHYKKTTTKNKQKKQQQQKTPLKTIKQNCQKICSWVRRPETYWKSEKKGSTFLRASTSPLFTSFSRTPYTRRSYPAGPNLNTYAIDILRDVMKNLFDLKSSKNTFAQGYPVGFCPIEALKCPFPKLVPFSFL